MLGGLPSKPVPLPPGSAAPLFGQPESEDILQLHDEGGALGSFAKSSELTQSTDSLGTPQQARRSPRAEAYSKKGFVRSGTHDGLLAEVSQMRKSQMMEDKKMQLRVMQEKLGASAKVNLSDVLAPQDVEESGRIAYLRWCCRRVIIQQKFDACMGLVILLNSLCIGMESEFSLQNQDITVFLVLEHLFLVVYLVELLMRFFALGRSCLQSAWVRFDLLLVTLGVVTDWIIEPAVHDATMLGPLMVVRVLRLARLARTLRLLVQFQALWALVRGFFSSLSTMIYAVLLVTLMLYLFACLGAEVITKSSMVEDDPEFGFLVENHFDSLPTIMLTLLQMVTFDSVAHIYVPMIKKQPYLLFYFVGFMVIVNITLMNLITAVIVEGAIENGKADRDAKLAVNKKKREKMLPRIRALFEQLDRDKGGTVTLDEVANAEGRMKDELLELIQSDNIVELFELLDIDGSGELDIQEFIDGIMMAVTSDTPIEFVRMQKQLVHLRDKTASVEKALTIVVEQIGAHGLRLKQITAYCTSMGRTLQAICEHVGGTREEASVGGKSETPVRCVSYRPG